MTKLDAAVLLGVSATALAVRWPVAWLGLPYLYFVDEPQVVHSAVAMLRDGTLDPGFWSYGPVPATLVAAVLGAWGHLPDLGGVALPRVDPAGVETPVPEAFHLARLLACALGTATAAFTTAAARRLTTRPLVALAAGLGVALSPGFVLASSAATVDGFAACASAAALLVALRADADGWPRADVLVAALLVAAGIASKYHPVLLVAPIASLLPADRRRGFLIAVAAGALLLMPALVLHPLAAAGGLAAELVHYGGARPTVLPGPDALVFQLSTLVDQLSLPVVALAAAGAWKGDRVARALALPVGLYLLTMTVARVEFPRNLYVVYPWIAALAALGAERLAGASVPAGLRPAAALCAGILAVHAGGTFARTVTRSVEIAREPRDTRSRILDDAPPLAGIAAELRLHPLDLARARDARVLPLDELRGLDGPCLVPADAAPGAGALARPGELSAARPLKNPAVAIVACEAIRGIGFDPR